MKRRPYAGLLVLLVLVAASLMRSPAPVHAQLGVFGTGDEDGGDGGGLLAPRRFIDNPWKRDAGNVDSGPGLTDIFKRFQGGGSSYLKERAPALADLVDSDASFLPWGNDGGGGGFSFTIPSFGANVDAGTPDVGPVVAPVVRIAWPMDAVTVFSTFQAPKGTVWARVPPASQAALRAAWPMDARGNPVAAHVDALSKPQKAALWKALAATRGFTEGGPGFLLSDVGAPVAAKLVALGVRGSGEERVFYAGYAPPRDGVQPVAPRVVLAASANVGRFAVPQRARPEVNKAVRAAAQQLAAVGGLPFGRTSAPRVGTVHLVAVRGVDGGRVELHVREKDPPRGLAPLCFEATVDSRDRLVRHVPWSPVCDHVALAAVDVDGDGRDEVLWREGTTAVLRRYPDGAVVDMDPPGGVGLEQHP